MTSGKVRGGYFIPTDTITTLFSRRFAALPYTTRPDLSNDVFTTSLHKSKLLVKILYIRKAKKNVLNKKSARQRGRIYLSSPQVDSRVIMIPMELKMQPTIHLERKVEHRRAKI
jgi:hypothetical protein